MYNKHDVTQMGTSNTNYQLQLRAESIITELDSTGRKGITISKGKGPSLCCTSRESSSLGYSSREGSLLVCSFEEGSSFTGLLIEEGSSLATYPCQMREG